MKLPHGNRTVLYRERETQTCGVGPERQSRHSRGQMGRDIQLSALYSPNPTPSIPCFNAISICSMGCFPRNRCCSSCNPAPHWQMESGWVWRLLLAITASRPWVHLHCQSSTGMDRLWRGLAEFQQESSVEQSQDTGIQGRLARETKLIITHHACCQRPFTVSLDEALCNLL